MSGEPVPPDADSGVVRAGAFLGSSKFEAAVNFIIAAVLLLLGMVAGSMMDRGKFSVAEMTGPPVVFASGPCLGFYLYRATAIRESRVVLLNWAPVILGIMAVVVSIVVWG